MCTINSQAPYNINKNFVSVRDHRQKNMSETDQNAKPEGHDGEVETQENIDEPASCEPSSVQQNKSDDKVELFLKATGDAPIMKKKKWVVRKSMTISEVASFIRKYLKLEKSDNMFLYVSQAFAPAPDQTCGNLHKCYGTIGADGSLGALVLHYSKVQAWG